MLVHDLFAKNAYLVYLAQSGSKDIDRLNLHGIIVDGSHGVDGRGVVCHGRDCLGAFKGEHYIGCFYFVAVMELCTLPQIESVGHAIVGKFIALSDSRLQLHFAVQEEECFINLTINLNIRDSGCSVGIHAGNLAGNTELDIGSR